MWKQRLAWTLVGLSCAVACGGSSSSDDSSGSGATLALEDVPAAYAETFCGLMERCNLFVQAFVPGKDCENYFLKTLDNQGFDSLVDAIEDGRASYDGNQMRACLDALADRDCDELDGAEPPSCEQAAAGTVDEGGDCTADIECEGDRICVFDDSCPGKCSDKLGAGGECTDDDRCRDGLVCSSDTGRCVAPAAEGEDCEGGVAPVCEGTLFCLGQDDEEGIAGTCRAMDDVFTAEPGEECDLEAGPLCEEGAACVVVFEDNEAHFECRALAKVGEDCSLGLVNPCERGSFCAWSGAMLQGTCEPQLEAGEDCNPAWFGACKFDSVCVADSEDPTTGRCVGKKNNGVSCASNNECWSEHCVDGGCAPTTACKG